MPPTQPHRLTDGNANDQLLYFTSPSLTSNDTTLVFLSDRDSRIAKDHDPHAAVNLYALDRESGMVRRLSDNHEGYLRSYVYFEGLPYRGLGLASPCLHPASGDVYYLQGRELRCVNAHTGTMRTLAVLPDGHLTGFTHVSNDNTRICVPTIPEAAFTDIRAIDATVQQLGLSSSLRVFDTRSGNQVQHITIERGWVTHVQFQPGNNDVILFNHEWPSNDGGIRRVWLWDGQQVRCMREEGANPHGEPRSRNDWVCHEVWSDDGAWILYHGTYGGHNQGRSFLGRVRPDGSRRSEVPFAAHFRRYGHFTLASNSATRLVSDGYYEATATTSVASGDPALSGRPDGGEWIALFDVDWDRETIDWQPLCRHGSSWASQDAHP
ncbi:MAG TPA: hypothetical protein PKC19_22645, partial [Roseiflexaceae bacterium]|nr:hypothetical protein [Roseiflexaceae bacterium]